MENPCSKEQILRLVDRQHESLKVDYKREYRELANKDYRKRELPKDVSAMANTLTPDQTLSQLGLDEHMGFIVIGADEEGSVHDVSDTLAVMDDDGKWQQAINSHLEPSVNFLFIPFDHVDAAGRAVKFGVLVIYESSCPPHRIAADIQIKGRIVEKRGMCYVREGTSTRPATDLELQRMYAHRARYSEEASRLESEAFKVSDREVSRLSSVYVSPRPQTWIAEGVEKLRDHRFLLISGPMGIGKRSTALYFGLKLVDAGDASRVIRVSRFTPLEDILGATSQVILLPDAFGLFRLERPEIEEDLGLLEELLRSNYMIATSSDVVLNDLTGETRLDEWLPFRLGRLTLNEDAYSPESLRRILIRHVKYAGERGIISQQQRDWVLGRLADRQSALSKAAAKLTAPLSIVRLVEEHLPHVSNPEEIIEAAAAVADLQQELKTWFLSLDAGRQTFAFALSVFSGLDDRTLWRLYTGLVEELRSLDPTLPVLPLGILRHRLAPFVSEEGAVEFTHPAYQQALLAIVAECYREYFFELQDFFVREGVPPAQAAREIADETRDVRLALATAAGEVAKHDLNATNHLLTQWASHKLGSVSVAAGVALRRAAEDESQLDHVFHLIREWARDHSDRGSYRRWAAVAALGRIGQADPLRAAKELEWLARDSNSYVRSAIPRALRMVKEAPAELEWRVLLRLAQDDDEFTRGEIMASLRGLARRNPQMTSRMLHAWSRLVDPSVRLMALVGWALLPELADSERRQAFCRVLKSSSDVIPQFLEAVLQDWALGPLPPSFASNRLLDLLPSEFAPVLKAAPSQDSVPDLLMMIAGDSEPARDIALNLLAESRQLERMAELISHRREVDVSGATAFLAFVADHQPQLAISLLQEWAPSEESRHLNPAARRAARLSALRCHTIPEQTRHAVLTDLFWHDPSSVVQILSDATDDRLLLILGDAVVKSVPEELAKIGRAAVPGLQEAGAAADVKVSRTAATALKRIELPTETLSPPAPAIVGALAAFALIVALLCSQMWPQVRGSTSLSGCSVVAALLGTGCAAVLFIARRGACPVCETELRCWSWEKRILCPECGVQLRVVHGQLLLE